MSTTTEPCVDRIPFTHRELHDLLLTARAITLKHRVFTHLGFEWVADPMLMVLMIEVRACVPDRDAPSTYGAEHYDAATGLVFDRIPQRNPFDALRDQASAAVAMPTKRYQPLVPILVRIPIRVERAQLAERGMLLKHLAREARSALIHACTHEIDEMLLVEGTRERDPHSIFPFEYPGEAGQ